MTEAIGIHLASSGRLAPTCGGGFQSSSDIRLRPKSPDPPAASHDTTIASSPRPSGCRLTSTEKVTPPLVPRTTGCGSASGPAGCLAVLATFVTAGGSAGVRSLSTLIGYLAVSRRGANTTQRECGSHPCCRRQTAEVHERSEVGSTHRAGERATSVGCCPPRRAKRPPPSLTHIEPGSNQWPLPCREKFPSCDPKGLRDTAMPVLRITPPCGVPSSRSVWSPLPIWRVSTR